MADTVLILKGVTKAAKMVSYLIRDNGFTGIFIFIFNGCVRTV